MTPLPSPVRLDIPVGIQCCEHCLTVTWAGVPACGCEFGHQSTSESAIENLYQARTSDQ